MARAPDDLVVFCEQQHPRLVGALSLYCGDTLLAEEFAQDALRRACRDWPKVRQMVAPGAWVHRVGMNLAHSWFRRRSAERRALARSHQDLVERPPETAEQLAVRESVARLRATKPGRSSTGLAEQYLGGPYPREFDRVVFLVTPERAVAHDYA